MMFLFWILVIVFILVCLLLGFFILIQSDKGGGISGAIGGGLGGAQSLLGTQDTANFLTRTTVLLGSAFLVLCVIMSIIISHQTFTVDKSILQKRAEKQQEYSPASVLGGQQGLPIKGGEGEQSPGLPVAPAGDNQTQQTAPATGTATQPVETKSLPTGAIPIAKPPVKEEAKK